MAIFYILCPGALVSCSLVQIICGSQQFVVDWSNFTPCSLTQFFQTGTALENVLRSLFLCATRALCHQAHSFHVLVQATVTCPQAVYHSLFSPVEAVNVVLVRAITTELINNIFFKYIK